MIRRSGLRWIALAVAAVIASGCVTARPPTIAHVHIGHALTGVHVTPDHKGYVLVAEKRADEALEEATRAGKAASLNELKDDVALVLKATDSEEDFGLKQSLILAANHISFAATSADASDNVMRFAPEFKTNIAAVVGRCDYIALLGRDVASTTSLAQASLIVKELTKAVRANVEGDDSGGHGVRGAIPADYGMLQLRDQLTGMITRENPPYRTVDDWYLFNLVRLPNGRWVFDKLGRGGNIDGYK